MYDHLLGSRPILPHPQSSRSKLLDVRSHRPPESPKFSRRRSSRHRRSLRHLSPRSHRHLRNELRKSRLRQSPRTCPSSSQSSRIQSARRQHSHLLQAFRLLRSLPTRKGYLRRRPPPLHFRIWQAPSRRKTSLIHSPKTKRRMPHQHAPPSLLLNFAYIAFAAKIPAKFFLYREKRKIQRIAVTTPGCHPVWLSSP